MRVRRLFGKEKPSSSFFAAKKRQFWRHLGRVGWQFAAEGRIFLKSNTTSPKELEGAEQGRFQFLLY